MSSALVRQALEFVDQEGITGNRKKRGPGPKRPGVKGQETTHPHKGKDKKADTKQSSKEQKIEENIKKLLALSKPAANITVAERIVERAVKGKPLLDKIPIKRDSQKSILFPDEEEPSHKRKRK